MKSALLLWDQVESITPWHSYPISYSEFGYNADDTKNLERAHRLIIHEHVPTEEEKHAAHDRVIELATTPNLPEWFLKRAAKDARARVRFSDQN